MFDDFYDACGCGAFELPWHEFSADVFFDVFERVEFDVAHVLHGGEPELCVLAALVVGVLDEGEEALVVGRFFASHHVDHALCDADVDAEFGVVSQQIAKVDVCDFSAAHNDVLEVAVAYAEDEGQDAGAYGGGDELVADILDAGVSVGVVDVCTETVSERVECERWQHDDPASPAHAEDVVVNATYAAEFVQHMCNNHCVAVFANVFVFDQNVQAAFGGLQWNHMGFGGTGQLFRRADAGAQDLWVVGHGDGVLWSYGALGARALDEFVNVLDESFGLS